MPSFPDHERDQGEPYDFTRSVIVRPIKPCHGQNRSSSEKTVEEIHGSGHSFLGFAARHRSQRQPRPLYDDTVPHWSLSSVERVPLFIVGSE